MRYRFAFRPVAAGIKGRSVAAVLASALRSDARNRGSRVSDVRISESDALYFTMAVPESNELRASSVREPDDFATGFCHGLCVLLQDGDWAMCIGRVETADRDAAAAAAAGGGR